jgi:hypothetical protein
MIGVSNSNQRPSNFYGAGCAFTDRNKILAGTSFKPLGDIRMSGFGGKRRGCETAEETAWREVLEELFDWTSQEIPDSLLAFCFGLEPIGCLEKKGYICFIYTFTQLEEILKRIERPSPLYLNIPRTLGELVFDRKFIMKSPFDKEACPEINQIVVLSLYRQSVDIEFYDDIIDIYDKYARKF